MKSECCILFLFATVTFRFVSCSNGCVPIDSYSFDKLVSKFKATLIKFDTAYPYGKKQDEYEKVCAATRNIDNLLVAEIAIKDYGEKDNADLGEKFGIEKDNFPVVKLLIEGKSEPFTFIADTEEDFTEENLKEFVRKKSNIYIGLQGCLEKFDKIVEKFVNEKSTDSKKKLLKEAETIWDNTKGNEQQKSAEVYVKYMRKLLEVGDEFVNNETNRIKNIVKGKIGKNKKQELEQKINILRAFKVKDEL